MRVCHDPASTDPVSYHHIEELSHPRQNRNESIAVVITIIVSIVMMSMVSVPPLPAIFVGVIIIAVPIIAVVVRSVLLVAGVNINAEPTVCFGIGGCYGKQPERRQT